MSTLNPYKKRGSLQHWIAERYLDGATMRDVKSEGTAIVREQQDSRFIFGANVGGGRVPKPIAQQLVEFDRTVDRTWRDLVARGVKPRDADDKLQDYDKRGEGDGQGDGDGKSESGSDGDAENGQDGDAESESESEGEGEGEGQSEGDAESDAEGESNGQQQQPPPPPKSTDKDWRWYEKEVRRLSKFLRERAESGDFVDDFGMRPLIDGAKIYRQGVPAVGLLHAATMSWSDETKAEAKVASWDPIEICEDVTGPNGERLHPLASYILRLAKARVPVLLVGPKGSGKSHLAADTAKLLTASNGRTYPYGETPMTAGASPSWLIGGETMSGYRSRPFVEIYREGGVFTFEEIDAADPNMTIVVNNALAADAFYNPANGTTVYRSPDFVPMATANTYGLGANREYTGRERLDGAFLDRFRMGRVFVPVDLDLGESIARGIIDAEKVDPKLARIAALEAEIESLRV